MGGFLEGEACGYLPEGTLGRLFCLFQQTINQFDRVERLEDVDVENWRRVRSVMYMDR